MKRSAPRPALPSLVSNCGRITCNPESFEEPGRSRVGGGASSCPDAGHRLPLKLHVRFSRMQLSTTKAHPSEMQSRY